MRLKAERLKAERLRDGVQRLAARGGDLTEIRSGLDQLLRAAIGYQFAAISTTDPATSLWTSCFVSGLSPEGARERERVIFELEFLGTDVNGYRELAHARPPIGRLHHATGGDLRKAKRWDPLLRSFDTVDEMRVILRTGDACWGTLTLYRAGDAAPFSDGDEAEVADAIPAMADLVRLTLLRAALDAPHALEQPPGLLMVDADGNVETTSLAARAWLDTIDDRDRIPSAVRAVAAATLAGDGLARAALPGRDGSWVVLHGSAVSHEGASPDERPTVAVIIEGARPSLLAEVIAGAYGLTTREREITALAAQGYSTKHIARDLGISPFTVQDHLKSVYAKCDVRSRAELVAALFTRHYEPQQDRGSVPGPYGWYLDDHIRLPA